MVVPDSSRICARPIFGLKNECVSYSRFSDTHTTATTTPIMEDGEEKKKKMKTGFGVAMRRPTSSAGLKSGPLSNVKQFYVMMKFFVLNHFRKQIM